MVYLYTLIDWRNNHETLKVNIKESLQLETQESLGNILERTGIFPENWGSTKEILCSASLPTQGIYSKFHIPASLANTVIHTAL
jgi:hypothetical protein